MYAESTDTGCVYYHCVCLCLYESKIESEGERENCFFVFLWMLIRALKILPRSCY